MTATQYPGTEHLLLKLDGLVPLHLLNIADLGAERVLADTAARTLARLRDDLGPEDIALAERSAPAQVLTDLLAGYGDRLAAPGNFRRPADRRIRAALLSAAALVLALGALNDGGIDWAGGHWCTRPHPDCPHDRKEAWDGRAS